MNNIKLEKEPVSKKSIFLGIGLIILYILLGIIPAFFPDKCYTLSMIISNILTIMVAILFFKNRLKRDIKFLKDNYKQYTQFIIKYQCIMFVIYLTSSVLSFLFSYLLFGNMSETVNQQAIEAMPMWLIIFSALLYAPVVEELLFRGSFRRFIKNDIVFIVVSGLVFGLLHTIYEPTFLEALIKGIPYIFVGGYFAYLYVKTENVTTSIISHFLHNFIAVLAIIFLHI